MTYANDVSGSSLDSGPDPSDFGTSSKKLLNRTTARTSTTPRTATLALPSQLWELGWKSGELCVGAPRSEDGGWFNLKSNGTQYRPASWVDEGWLVSHPLFLKKSLIYEKWNSFPLKLQSRDQMEACSHLADSMRTHSIFETMHFYKTCIYFLNEVKITQQLICKH